MAISADGTAQYRPASETQPNQLGVNATRQRVIKEREKKPKYADKGITQYGVWYYCGSNSYLAIHMADITETTRKMYNTYLKVT